MIARRQHDADREANCLSLMAYQSASVGRFTDAEALLQRVGNRGLSRQTLYNYYRALNYVNSEESYFSGVKSIRDSLAVEAGQYEARLFEIAVKRSPAYKELLCSTLFNNNQLDAAMHVNDDWLAMTPDSSREFVQVSPSRPTTGGPTSSPSLTAATCGAIRKWSRPRRAASACSGRRIGLATAPR